MRTATLSGPIAGGTRGHPFVSDKVPDGYVETEYFMTGQAGRYRRSGEWQTDGLWPIEPDGSDDYTVRIWVRRPADSTCFSGVVLTEWLNVTAQREIPGDYLHMRDEIVRAGHVWVGVGAQVAGIHAEGTGLKAWDPERYAPLHLPSDACSYDVFADAARALRAPGGVDPLDGMRPKLLIATGRSQGARRLVTYINAFQQQHGLFDGFYLHSRTRSGASLTTTGLAEAASEPMPDGANIRADNTAPVFDLQAEGDLVVLRSHLTRQPPSKTYCRWELAGSAHVQDPTWVAQAPLGMGFGCKLPVNTATHDAFVRAGLAALIRWLQDGTEPPRPPDIELSDPNAGDPVADSDPVADFDPVARDPHGNALGGVRLPQVEVPTARVDGRRNEPGEKGGPMAPFCFLYGSAEAFDADTLARLYPSHDEFVDAFIAIVDQLLGDGYLLEADARAARQAARDSTIGA